MYDFETLVGELIQSRPELSREELMRRVENKKQTIGAGYLTDQGALFLVAGELGVSLRKEGPSSDMTVKDLYIGANDVTVVARVLAIYPESTYNKKDGGSGRYRRLVLFDGQHTARMTVWEEGLEGIEKLGLAPDSLVRVVNGYVKQGLDGKPNLNLGKRGRIETVEEGAMAQKLPRLASMAEKVNGSVGQERQFVAIEGTVSSDPRYSEFVRQDGSPGSLFQFGIAGSGGNGDVRVVVWGPTVRPELRPGQAVVVTNLRSRRGTNGEFELHGDAGSVVTPAKAKRMEARVAAVLGGPSGQTMLVIDREKKIFSVETTSVAPLWKEGALVGVVPDSQVGGKLKCTSPGSLEAVDDDSFPKLQDLSSKLKELKTEGQPVLVEVIALSHGEVEEIRLKDGSTTKRGELVVGDDTAETKVVGWRELAGKVSGIQPGERLRVVGTTPKQTKIGTWELQVTAATSISRVVSSA